MSTYKQRKLLNGGLIVGGLVGTAAAYFLAPQTGDVTKKKLARTANRLTQTSILHVQNLLIKFESKLEKDIIKDKLSQ